MKPSFRKAWTHYVEFEIAVVSAALAYHTLLAIVPVVGLGFWYLEKIGVTERWIQMTRQYVFEQLNVTSSTVFLKNFDQFTAKVQGISWGWIGSAFLLYTSISLLAKFGRGLDSVMNVRSEITGSPGHKVWVWLRRAIGLAGLPLALTVSIGVSQWLKHDSWFNQVLKIKHVGPVLGLPISWVTTVTSVFFVYYFIPSRRVGAKLAFSVAVVIGPILEILRTMLGFYAKYAVSGQKIYGLFSVIPLFILWVQLSWAVLLSGAAWLRIKFEK